MNIKILGHSVSVEFDPLLQHHRGSNGSYCANTLEIKLDSTKPKSLQEEALLHEIFEAIMYHLDCSDTIAHPLMSSISEVLYQIIKDNPHIFEIHLLDQKIYCENHKADRQDRFVTVVMNGPRGPQTFEKVPLPDVRFVRLEGNFRMENELFSDVHFVAVDEEKYTYRMPK